MQSCMEWRVGAPTQRKSRLSPLSALRIVLVVCALLAWRWGSSFLATPRWTQIPSSRSKPHSCSPSLLRSDAATAHLAKALDPGRAELCTEFLTDGEEVFRSRLGTGGSLRVTRHNASEQDSPMDSHQGWKQEWRVLSFKPDEGVSGQPEGHLLQAVAKVYVMPEDASKIIQRGDVLIQFYARSMVAVVLSTLEALGLPVVSACNGNDPSQRLRILCIGLGAGSLPRFLVDALPNCEVDAVELEPSVVSAAKGAMGLMEDERLHVFVEDGAVFASRMVEAIAAERSDACCGQYDAVLIDAFDAAGNTPGPLVALDGGVCRALTRGLIRKRGGVVAVNFLESVDVGARLAAYREALSSRQAGPSFSVRTMDYGWRVVGKEPDGQDRIEVFPVEGGAGNYIAVQTCGGGVTFDQLRQRLPGAAGAVAAAIDCPYDLGELAVRGLKEWRP